jgi:hypothetical protein
MEIRTLLSVVTLLMMLGAPAPAKAVIIQWSLIDVAPSAFEGISGPSVTGYFDVNSESDTGLIPVGGASVQIASVSSFDITVSGFPGQSMPFTLTQNNATATPIGGTSAQPPNFNTVGFSAVGEPEGVTLAVDGAVRLTQLLGSVQLNGRSVVSNNTGVYTDGIEGVYVSGELSSSVSAVPLPPALPLFGLGLLGLMGYGQFKKRRPNV